MNVLIVFAHPEAHSFCGALKDTAVERLTALGYTVEVSDLYRQGFSPIGGPADFRHELADGPFNYQTEQRRAHANGSYANDVATEQAKVARADLLMLNFPLWWFGPPAILKGWIDRVLSVGFAYDSDRRFDRAPLRGRKGMVTVTTGSPVERFTAGTPRAYASVEDTLMPLQKGLFGYIGLEPIPPFLAFAPARSPEEDRQALLRHYAEHLTAAAGLDGGAQRALHTNGA
ncbi:NAD(P)H-dependent oxidoreductase [Azospirillum sp. YIM B02556]|uniref:NAD(P)H-dependent oxidoreductase n=1 Tax=Azospirillum endophyticum TaxID=2800326 RepID=A0ABS1EZE4_9PROT|nr:NAD(P)H-dependent oxidoreductase [Azospirillum endophyticum]MBK1836544.1 NAD(P)H-dependent oxidoreductase [Azospirillum endophyticum]